MTFDVQRIESFTKEYCQIIGPDNTDPESTLLVLPENKLIALERIFVRYRVDVEYLANLIHHSERGSVATVQSEGQKLILLPAQKKSLFTSIRVKTIPMHIQEAMEE